MEAHSVLILCRQCGVINKQHYVQWRERGLAFEMREGVYQVTNPSLLSLRVFSQVSVTASRCYTMQQDDDRLKEFNFVYVLIEREQSGCDGLLGRHSIQSLPLLWH